MCPWKGSNVINTVESGTWSPPSHRHPRLSFVFVRNEFSRHTYTYIRTYVRNVVWHGIPNWKVRNMRWNKPHYDKTNKMTCTPSEDSDQPGHTPSLIRVFAVRMKKDWVLSYPLSAQRRVRSDWADAQADLSLHWVHMSFCWFCCAAAQIIWHWWF